MIMKEPNRILVRLGVLAAVLVVPGCDEPNSAGGSDETASAEEVEGEQESFTRLQSRTGADANDVEAGSFARERGISLADARLRLDRQVLAPEFAAAAEIELGERFGGVWIDTKDNDVIKVGVTSSGKHEAEAIDRLARGVGLDGGYRAVPVRHSMAALERVNSFLADQLAAVNPSDGPSLTAGLRTDINAVELQTPIEGELSAAQQELVLTAKEQFGALLVVHSYHGRPTARACVYPDCDPPLRGGIRITNSGTCTGGFVATSNSDGKPYQFTAGHCAALGGVDDWSAYFTNKVAHVIGPVWNWRWNSGGDMAILRINNPLGWSPKPWVNVTSGPDTASDSQYHISSDGGALIGMRICTTGAAYGRSSCGFVTQLAHTMTYGGVTVMGLGRGSFCGTGGDSGAPMFASHVAYGLQVSGYSECDSVFQGIHAAEVAFNVGVVHG